MTERELEIMNHPIFSDIKILNKTKVLKDYFENPETYEMFERFALEMAQVRPYYGAKSIAERVRWHTVVSQEGKEDFKLNNNSIPVYARLFTILNPKHEGFFRLRSNHGRQSQGVGERID